MNVNLSCEAGIFQDFDALGCKRGRSFASHISSMSFDSSYKFSKLSEALSFHQSFSIKYFFIFFVV